MLRMDRETEIELLGVSFRTAPLEVRQALSFDVRQAVSLLRRATGDEDGVEAAILSTCNRTEFYVVSPTGLEASERWLEALRRLRPGAPILHDACLRQRKRGSEAVRHLCRVACGLDSLVLGDVQVQGQVKEAMALATESGTLGRLLTRAFDHAIRAGRRARRETDVAHGSASTGSAVAGILTERVRGPAGAAEARILLIGAGEAARCIARHVAKAGLGELRLVNRTPERAVELARHVGGTAVAWFNLATEALSADAIVSATSAPTPILRRELLERLARRIRPGPPILIDVGVPPNAEAGSGLEVVDADSIGDRQDEGLERRRRAVPAVERIVDAEVRSWERWRASPPMEAIIKELYAGAETLSTEAARHLVDVASVSQDRTAQILLRSLKHLLHGHVGRLRELGISTEARKCTCEHS